MKKYVPAYDSSPFGGDLEAERASLVTHPDDIQLFAHVGHYVTWYAIVEFMLTTLLWAYTGKLAPDDFQALTRGMDAKVKLERLLGVCKREGIAIGPTLKKRLEHFQKALVPLRNKLVHSYLYWAPKDDVLQICSIGALPAFEGMPTFNGPPPERVQGMLVFERGQWLNAFSRDLVKLVQDLPPTGRPTRGSTLEIVTPQSGLPKGAPDHPG